MASVHPSDPIHQQSGPGTYWTTVNTAEAMPGVMTPLGWTFWGDALERAMRGSFVDLGVLERREMTPPADADDRFTAIFRGRVAANVDLLREIAGDRMPGTSATALELQLLGGVRDGVADRPTRRRFPVVATRLPVAAGMLPRRLRSIRAQTDGWWRAAVFADAVDADRARSLLTEALDRFTTVMRLHSFASFVCHGAYDQVAQLATRSGSPGAETRLVSGYGGMEETAIAADLWEVSRGTLELDAFVSRHGYHGPHEGEVSSRSWREDPRPLHTAVARYRDLPDDHHPRLVERGRIADRRTAERELAHGPRDRAVLAAARRYIPLREVGKAAFLQTIDVARFAARVLGADLVRSGHLRDAEDVSALTVDELRAPPVDGLAETVEYRTGRRAEYLTTTLPDSWTGTPEPVAILDAAGDDTAAISGVAASAGTHVGTARVVTDPATAEIDEGDVVVCETTDPSWTLIFVVAGAMVIDIGGPISHGAIVAREMGIPCVVNTRTGTRTIRNGDRVKVDGSTGGVEILARATEKTGDRDG